ncbi:MAG: hypothetical protein JNL83_11305 [Myxococcales bacterium]|nr:hypothetical protein [Myxococcales bacterium]
MRVGLARFLALWRGTELAAHPERVRVVSFAMPLPCKELAGLEREHPDRLLAWDNRYFVRTAGIQHGHAVVRGLEVTADGVFRLPAGATLVEERSTDRRFTPASIDRALALLRERGPLPFTPELASALAAQTGLGVPAASLLWAAGYEPWLAGSAVQAALGITREGLALAELELRGKRLRELYADAMTDDPAALYGATVVPRLAAAWSVRFGTTTELPTELITALRADLPDGKLPLERDARTLLDPDRASVLTIDAPWVMRPAPGFDASKRTFDGVLPNGWPVPHRDGRDGAPDADDVFHGYALSRFTRYLAWAHLALPGEAPARAGAARVGALVHARLAAPQLLVLAALVDLTRYDNAAFASSPTRDAAATFAAIKQRFAGMPYIAADGGPAATGFDRGDAVVTWPAEENGLFIAFRPHQLADDAALARFLDDVGARAAYERTHGAAPISVDYPGASIICPPSFGHWLVWRSAGFQRLVDALRAPLPAGRFASDPRVSAPAAVAKIRAAHDLDEAAATLRLQQLVLPFTERSRICRINGWSAAEHDRARGSLEARPLAAPAPRVVHGLGPADEPTFGVLLPLRPLGELFAAAARLP